MKLMSAAGLVAATLAVSWAIGRMTVDAQVNSNDNRVSVMDACDPTSAFVPPGCDLNPQQGDVSFAEFGMLLTSPLTDPPHGVLIGHPAWRNEPAHLSANRAPGVRVTNTGGRGHTYTEVAEFGGGFVDQLNIGLEPAPECINGSAVPLPPGATQVLNLSTGLHKFQCCIHPWMRGTIRVE